MSADGKDTTCPTTSEEISHIVKTKNISEVSSETCEKKSTKTPRKVSFPKEEELVTKYFEPANPWQDVPTTSRAQLAAEYLECCRAHHTPAIESVLQQIRDLPENAIGGASRAPRLTLADCSLVGCSPVDALEALFRKVQFRRIELDHVEIDDEGAEAIFDMIEYYESATVICVVGPRHYGIRGWQATSRMIKKSSELTELEVCEGPLEANHAPVLARALRPAGCPLRSLCLQRADLSGESLLCLVIALKSNSSVRELRLGDNQLTAKDAAQLASLLRLNTRLQLLDLSNNLIQDAGVVHLSKALVEQASDTPPSAATSPLSPHNCPISGYDSRGLAFLVLWNNQLTRNCAVHLAKVLVSHSLCVLNVGRNALGSEAVRALHEGVGARSGTGSGSGIGGGSGGGGGALLSLGLQAARLGPDAARPLAQLLAADTRLQRLDLRDNRLGNAGLQMILNALKDNTTITQIDLDEPSDSNGARVAREIRALCRRNEPPVTNRLHRKISLTCHTARLAAGGNTEEERKPGIGGGRLRSPAPSPAPSPAGSPIPLAQHSRFSVTRVTPDRESSDSPSPSTPSRPPFCPTSSRFKVVQVVEPPQIQVHPATQSRRSSSRFSVTRNYDSIYNTTLSPSPSSTASPSPEPSIGPSTEPSVAPSIAPNIGSNLTPSEKISLASTPEPTPPSTAPNITPNVAITSVFSNPSTEPSIWSNAKANPELENNAPSVKTSAISNKVSTIQETSIRPNVKANTEPNVVNEIEPSPKSIPPTIVKSEPPIQMEPRDFRPGRFSVQPVIVKAISEPVKMADWSVASVESHSEIKPANAGLIGVFSMERLAPLVAESPRREDISTDSVSSLVPKVTFSDEMKETKMASNNVIDKVVTTDSTIDNNSKLSDKENKPFDMSKQVDVFQEVPPCIRRKDLVGLEKDGSLFESSEMLTTDADLRETTTISVGFKDKPADVKKTEEPQGVSNKDRDVTEVISNICDMNIEDVVRRDILAVEQVLTDKLVSDSEISCKMNAADGERGGLSDIIDISDISQTSGFKDKTEDVSHNEVVSVVGGDKVLKTETKLVKTSVEVTDTEVVDVEVEFTIKRECSVNSGQTAKVISDINTRAPDIKVDICGEKSGDAIRHLGEITEDLGNIIQEMQDMSVKARAVKVKNDCTQTDLEVSSLDTFKDVKVRDVVLKKNKSESSLDSPDLEVSRLMNKKLTGSAFCDSSSSLEISGSSMESLSAVERDQHAARPIIIQETVGSDSELDRRRDPGTLSTESSIESTSDTTPVNSGFLNMSVSSNESVSPIIFGGKKIHGSLSSLEASMSSLESARQERVMVTSADSGIEYSLQNPTENKEDASSNEGTLTHNSSLKETVRNPEIFHLQETLTSPKRTSSLLDVPALKSKGLDRMRKISWVAPSSSFHIPRPDTDKIEMKLPSHLEKLLSLFQHPSSIFSRSSSSHSDDDKKSSSSTPPRKDSSLTSSFWSWGSATEKIDKEDNDSLSEATDSTLSERVQVSFVDESFSRKLDSKTPSTDTENTLSEFQTFPQSETRVDAVTDRTTDDKTVQILGISVNANVNSECSTGIRPVAGDRSDLSEENASDRDTKEAKDEARGSERKETRPRSFAAVLKSSGTGNSLDKPSPDSGPSVDKLPSKVIRGIKENISPENTLTSSVTNSEALERELSELKKSAVVQYEKAERLEDIKTDLAPIATVEEACDEAADSCVQLAYIDDDRIDESGLSDSGVTSLETIAERIEPKTAELENVDVGKDALSYLMYEQKPEIVQPEDRTPLDLSPELVIDEAVEAPEVFMAKEIKGLRSSPVIPERAKLKKSNSLEELSRRLAEADKAGAKKIAFKVPETTTPRDIPERRVKFRTRSGSSPKSLPESLIKPCPLAKMESGVAKKKKKASCLGRIARDSLLALNMSEEETAEFRSYKLTSVESLKSLESVSEDANSQSGTSADSRCRSCLRTSQESLMSLDSINEDCRCIYDCEKRSQSNR